MDDKQLYAEILGLTDPWTVERVQLELSGGEVRVDVALPSGEAAPIHDHKERRWRHLNTCQYRTILHARVLRLRCSKHGIKQVKVPRTEPGVTLHGIVRVLGHRQAAEG